MKAVQRRLDRLEDRLAPQGRKPFVIVVTDAAQKLALDSDRCVQILREAGRLDTRSLFCLVDLGIHLMAWTPRGWSATSESTASAAGPPEMPHELWAILIDIRFRHAEKRPGLKRQN